MRRDTRSRKSAMRSSFIPLHTKMRACLLLACLTVIGVASAVSICKPGEYRADCDVFAEEWKSLGVPSVEETRLPPLPAKKKEKKEPPSAQATKAPAKQWRGFDMPLSREGVMQEIDDLCNNPSCCGDRAKQLGVLTYPSVFRRWMHVRLYLYSSMLFPSKDKTLEHKKRRAIFMDGVVRAHFIDFVRANAINPLKAWPLDIDTCTALNDLRSGFTSLSDDKIQRDTLDMMVAYDNIVQVLGAFHAGFYSPLAYVIENKDRAFAEALKAVQENKDPEAAIKAALKDKEKTTKTAEAKADGPTPVTRAKTPDR